MWRAVCVDELVEEMPLWYSVLPDIGKMAIVLSPLIIHFAAALFVKRWNYVSCLLYTAVVFITHADRVLEQGPCGDRDLISIVWIIFLSFGIPFLSGFIGISLRGRCVFTSD